MNKENDFKCPYGLCNRVQLGWKKGVIIYGGFQGRVLKWVDI